MNAVRTSRREALRLTLHGAAGWLIADQLAALAAPASAPAKAKAKSVIQIWMWGGPAHLDTLDPKPKAGYDYCGPLASAIPTNVDGILIGELLPRLARQADKYSIIRSMTHGYDGHETATYLVQTGRKPGDRLVYPGAGAVVSLLKGYNAGYKGLIPPCILLTQPLGHVALRAGEALGQLLAGDRGLAVAERRQHGLGLRGAAFVPGLFRGTGRLFERGSLRRHGLPLARLGRARGLFRLLVVQERQGLLLGDRRHQGIAALLGFEDEGAAPDVAQR